MRHTVLRTRAILSKYRVISLSRDFFGAQKNHVYDVALKRLHKQRTVP